MKIQEKNINKKHASHLVNIHSLSLMHMEMVFVVIMVLVPMR